MKSPRSAVLELVDEALHVNDPRAEIRALVEEDPPSEALALAIGACPGGVAIDTAVALVLANAVAREGRRSVLEFGAGSSSQLIATALDVTGGGRMTSVEHDPSWSSGRWSDAVDAAIDVDAVMVTSMLAYRLGRLGVIASYRTARSDLIRRAPYDLVLIDGPQYFHGRDAAIPLVWDLLTVGCLIVVDDAGRWGERLTIWKWLKTYPGLTLEHYDANASDYGIAILRKRADTGPRLSPLSFAVGVWQAYRRRWPSKRARRRETAVGQKTT